MKYEILFVIRKIVQVRSNGGKSYKKKSNNSMKHENCWIFYPDKEKNYWQSKFLVQSIRRRTPTIGAPALGYTAGTTSPGSVQRDFFL